MEPLAEKFPNLFSLSLNKDAYVDCWCIVTLSWNLGIRRNMFDNKLDNVASILEILYSWTLQMVMIVLNGLPMLMAASLGSLLLSI